MAVLCRLAILRDSDWWLLRSLITSLALRNCDQNVRYVATVSPVSRTGLRRGRIELGTADHLGCDVPPALVAVDGLGPPPHQRRERGRLSRRAALPAGPARVVTDTAGACRRRRAPAGGGASG